MNDSTRLVVAHEMLATFPSSQLAKMLVEESAQRLELERKADEWNDKYHELAHEIQAATLVLATVVTLIGGRDLLTLCEVVRTELIRLRTSQSGRVDTIR